MLVAKSILSSFLKNVNYKHHNDNEISTGISYYTKRGSDGMVADRIKQLREQANLTQAELAKQLGITRSSVNAWEMGISVPSTQYIVELAHRFKVTTDYLLCMDGSMMLDVTGLSEDDIILLNGIVRHLRSKNVK